MKLILRSIICWLNSSSSEYGPVVDFYEHGNEISFAKKRQGLFFFFL
jgi:hypothetical protein